MELTTGAAGEWDPILDGDGDYGTIAFASHTVASKADFIRLTQKDEQKLANIHKTFEEQEAMPTSFPLMKYIMTQWFNDPPKLLLRVSGGLRRSPRRTRKGPKRRGRRRGTERCVRRERR